LESITNRKEKKKDSAFSAILLSFLKLLNYWVKFEPD